MKKSILFGVLFSVSSAVGLAQNTWQQEVKYTMNVELNTKKHLLNGHQDLVYINNSPDTLHKVYYHLYLNAFQPGSMMDVRSRNISDPDRRVLDRISKLKSNEIGYQKIKYLNQAGVPLKFEIKGTVLKAELAHPLLPGDSVVFQMDFEAQVPVQIRRTGRNNKEGIDYTMTQWYPKMAEYDADGWHANEYVGREFYGVWGSFDVAITLDSSYTVAGTGVVTNPNEVGHGYGEVKPTKKKITWRFYAENVHDFAWAADPDYVHDIYKVDDQLNLHFFYQTDTLATQWREIQPSVAQIFKTVNETFGRYPYSDFSVIQGGDGGMEYPMCTMILGHGTKKGKVGLIAHESIHNWYYGVLGTNEYRYPWMDEGMTSYAEAYAMQKLYNEKPEDFLSNDYKAYKYLVKTGKEEPMSTPGDLFDHNLAYSISSYVKGALTLNQLRYIVGDSVFYAAMKNYFNTYKFTHPTPANFLREMELASDLELDWFFEHWVNTLHHIDYGVTLADSNNKFGVRIENVGNFPMPVEVLVQLKDGSTQNYYIPLQQMRGTKITTATVLAPWAWVNPTYFIPLSVDEDDILFVKIDPKNMLPDIDTNNNKFPIISANTEETK